MVLAVLLYLSSFKVRVHIVRDIFTAMPEQPGGLQIHALAMPNKKSRFGSLGHFLRFNR